MARAKRRTGTAASGKRASTEPGQTVRSRQKAETRAKLLASARKAFTKGSVVTTPLDAVAAGAGVSKATLFFHFAARQELLGALATDLRAELDGEAAGGKVAATLVPYLRRYLDRQSDPRARLLCEIGDVLRADGRPLPDGELDELEAEIERLLRDAGHSRAVASNVAGLLAPATVQTGRRIALGTKADGVGESFLGDVNRMLRREKRSAGTAVSTNSSRRAR